MPNILEELGAAVKKVAGDVSNEITIAAREQKLKEAYQKLGKMHYRAIRMCEDPEGPDFDRQTAVIRDLIQQIQDLRSGNFHAEEEDFED